jgi:hypothetical protein
MIGKQYISLSCLSSEERNVVVTHFVLYWIIFLGAPKIKVLVAQQHLKSHVPPNWKHFKVLGIHHPTKCLRAGS